jgi:hypothetical protein
MFIIITFLIFAGLLVYGYSQTKSIDAETIIRGHKFVGFGVAGLFFIVMPTFIFHRWKDKKVKDYMLTEENILKMKAFNDSKDS